MKKSKKTERYIIEKTANIFNKKGFIGTSLSDLTSATNLTKGSIYGNFKNKEDVAVAAFNFNYQNLIKRFRSRMSAESSAKGKLTAFLDIYIDSYEYLMQLGGCPILNNAVDTDDTNDSLNGLSVKAFEDWNRNLRTIIAQGIEDQEISETIDPEMYTDLFIVCIEGGLLLSKSTGKKRYFDHAMAHLKDIVAQLL